MGFKKINDLAKKTIKIPPEFKMPLAQDYGQVDNSNTNQIRKIDYWVLKSGLMCFECHSPCSKQHLSRQNGLNVCTSCLNKNFRRTNNRQLAKFKYEKRKPTKRRNWNHVAFIGRNSSGKPLSLEPFKKLENFAKKWKNFPHSATHQINVIDYFGANGSALANLSTMTEVCRPDKFGFQPEPVSDLIYRFQQVYQERDRVTIVAFQMAAISVKIINLVNFFCIFKILVMGIGLTDFKGFLLKFLIR
jgi:hypothetical protein